MYTLVKKIYPKVGIKTVLINNKFKTQYIIRYVSNKHCVSSRKVRRKKRRRNKPKEEITHLKHVVVDILRGGTFSR